MVFGLFSRRRESTQVLEPEPHAESSETPELGARAQLRTPSPSVNESGSIGKRPSPSREPPLTPSPQPEVLPEQVADDLRALIQSVPAQTLRAYTLSQLLPSNSLSPEVLVHISSFFSELAPPPRLHCVRCHKSYFDVENTDRSCLIPHDDESAEVERVNSKGQGSLYETLWGCCGRTVEGDGDMGPPDGWCYEGKHTTDAKRARFRADSTLQDDKLASCERLHCYGPPLRPIRKRGREAGDDEGDEDENEGESSVSVTMSASPRSPAGGRTRRTVKKPRTQIAPPEQPHVPAASASPDEMDVDQAPSVLIPPSTPPKNKPKSSTKPKASTSQHAKAKSLSTPKTSSPLVLLPPFVSRSVSPDPPSKVEVVIVPLMPKSSAASLKPKSSAASLKAKMKPSAGSSKLKASPTGPPPSPEKTRSKSVPFKGPSSASPKAKAKARGRRKGLAEVVDSSVDAERVGPRLSAKA